VRAAIEALTDVYFGEGTERDLKWSWRGPSLRLDISESDWSSIIGEGGEGELGDPFDVFWVVANGSLDYYPDMLNEYTIFWNSQDDR